MEKLIDDVLNLFFTVGEARGLLDLGTSANGKEFSQNMMEIAGMVIVGMIGSAVLV